MTDIERVCFAEDEFMDDYRPRCRPRESFNSAFNRYLAENYGIKYFWPNSADDCIEVIEPNCTLSFC